jgi:hypothetical protein
LPGAPGTAMLISGTEVWIFGLKARPDLNGMRGVVVAYVVERERYHVTIRSDAKEEMYLRRANLTAIGGCVSVDGVNGRVDGVAVTDDGAGTAVTLDASGTAPSGTDTQDTASAVPMDATDSVAVDASATASAVPMDGIAVTADATVPMDATANAPPVTTTESTPKTPHHPLIEKCIEAHVHFEHLLRLAVIFQTRPVKKEPFPCDFLLLLKAGCALDKLITQCADIVWIPNATLKVTRFLKDANLCTERLQKCETAVRMTSDPDHLRKIVLVKKWTPAQTAEACDSVVKLLHMARVRDQNSREQFANANQELAALQTWRYVLRFPNPGTLFTDPGEVHYVPEHLPVRQ